MILDEILTYKRIEIEEAKKAFPLNQLMAAIVAKPTTPRDFKGAIKRHPQEAIKLIAEVKKASPSKGIIRENFDPLEIAGIYSRSGANALSVLTDKKFFQGSPEYLVNIKKTIHQPLLRKDFIIDEYQVWESKFLGADAILLIVAGLTPAKIKNLYQLATIEAGLAVLVETHTEEEAQIAMGIGAEIIGINNRNLHTFQVDLKTTYNIRNIIPESRIVVSESGIKTRADVQKIASEGIDALLIGETLMRADSINAKINELFG